jgi:hypothetical protein
VHARGGLAQAPCSDFVGHWAGLLAALYSSGDATSALAAGKVYGVKRTIAPLSARSLNPR